MKQRALKIAAYHDCAAWCPIIRRDCLAASAALTDTG